MNTTVKTFRATDARSALAAVKQSLGSEAVILSTRSIAGGVFSAPQVEVTAALQQEPPRAAGRSAEAISRYQGPAAPVTAASPEPAAKEKKPRARQPPRPPRDSEQLLALSAQLEGLQLKLNARPSESPIHAHETAWLESLGMERALAERLMQQTSGAVDVKASMRARVEEGLRVAPAPWGPSNQRQVIALMGPTGVGKTTTIAKIAARALLESRRSVALITIDTYRIGASAQIARYGEIMNVPAYVASTAAELVATVQNCRADLVLIDTSGRSTTADLEAQRALVHAVPGVEVHLVLSATSGWAQLASTVRRYQSLKPSKLVFTKLDEAVNAGGLLTPLERLGLPVSCVTDGQRVPEDIQPAIAAQLAQRIFEASHE